MAIRSREMIKQEYQINGRQYCCYFKGNRTDTRAADLVFFNGLFNGASAWAYQTRIPGLLKDFRMIMFDYPCQGESVSLTGGFSVDDLTDDTIELARQLQLKKPLLIGHSFGGMLAGLVAGHPDIEAVVSGGIQGLMIANSSLRPSFGTDKLFWEIQRRMTLIGRSALSPQAQAEAIKDIFRFFVPIALGDDYLAFIEDMEASLLDGYAHYNRDPLAVAYLLEILLRNNSNIDFFCAVLARVQCPVLILAGVDDKIFPPRFSRELATVFSNASLIEVDNSGHSVMIEQNKIYNGHLLTFVETLFGSALNTQICSPVC